MILVSFSSLSLPPQETILQALKLSRAQQTQTVKQPPTPYKWTYASAFLYSLTLITTIGKNAFVYANPWAKFRLDVALMSVNKNLNFPLLS